MDGSFRRVCKYLHEHLLGARMNFGRMPSRYFLPLELSVLFVLLLLPLGYRLAFEIDFEILWGAGYRSTFGQIPYRDYGMPIGPVPAWILAGWFATISGSVSSLRYLDLIADVLAAGAFWLIARELRLDGVTRFFSTAIFIVTFSDKLCLPFYNSWVVTPMLVGTFLTLRACRPDATGLRSLIILSSAAGFVLGLAIFVKQDTGVLAVGLSLTLFLYNIRVRSMPLTGVFAFSLAVLMTTLAILSVVDRESFAYWFDHGQHAGGARLGQIFQGIFSEFGRLKISFILFAGLAFAHLAKHQPAGGRIHEAAIVVCGVTMISLVAGATSGRSIQTTQYFLAFGALVFFEFAGLLTRSRMLLPMALSLALMFSVPFVPQPLVLFDPLIHPRKLSLGGKTMSLASDAGLKAFGDVYLTDETIAAILNMKSWDLSRRPCSVLNLSELAPVEAELGVEPCRGVPLWTHLGVTLYPHEVDRYVRHIESKAFEGLIYAEKKTTLELRGSKIRDAIERNYVSERCVESYNDSDRLICFMKPKK